MKRIIAIAGACALIACTSYDPNQRIDPGVGIGGDQFLPVANAFLQHCGTIDCHGSKYRNMRFYGYGSERYSATDTPGSPETTTAEAEQDYESVVALEPSIIRVVIADGGKDPERLTFMRKARGKEDHKGGRLMTEGDPTDLCITSWLASNIDLASCRLAVPRLNAP
jgi:hypothetical protein